MLPSAGHTDTVEKMYRLNTVIQTRPVQLLIAQPRDVDAPLLAQHSNPMSALTVQQTHLISDNQVLSLIACTFPPLTNLEASSALNSLFLLFPPLALTDYLSFIMQH